MTGDTTPQDHATALKVAHAALRDNGIIGAGVLYATGAVVKALADAGLLCSSPVVQPQHDEGRSAPEPSAAAEVQAISDDSAVYIRLSNRPVNKTVSEYRDTVNVDLDDYNEPVGVEILGAIQVEIDGQPVHLPQAIGEADTEKLAAHLYAADCRDHNTDDGQSDAELWNTSSYVQGERDGHYRAMARAAVEFLRGLS